MSEYSGIRGTRVKYLASDPTLNTSTEGQVWYNSTSGTLKSLVQIKAWSSGGNLSTARYHSGPATSAPSTAGMVAAGFSNSSPETATNVTEEYNGFSWSSGGNVNTARANLGGAGIQTAALIFGGYSGAPNVGYNLTEEYDGSAWTSGGTLPVNTSLPIGAGTQTAGLSIGGLEIGVAALTTTNLYNGTSWTSTGHNINDDGYGGAGVGTSTAALIMGGDGRVSSVESYDGSSWTAVTNLVSANGRTAGAGTNTLANCFGGADNPTANQTWDGNTWVSVTGLSTGRARLMGFGTATQSVAAGGYTTTQLANTEEYVSSIDAYSPSTLSAWASGGAYPSTAVAVSGAGTQNAGIGFGGYDPGGNLATSYEYDGSSWTSSGSLSEARQAMGSAVSAPQSTALAFGGYNTPGPPYARSVTDEYNGSTWTTGGSMNTARDSAQGIGFGIQTAAVAAGGGPIPASTEVEEYNGSTWTVSGTSMPEGKKQNGSMGVSTAGAVFGGFNPSPAVTGSFLEYDGTTWTAGSSLSTARMGLGGAGTLSSGVAFKGWQPAETTATEYYNGTGWASSVNAATAAFYVGASAVNLSTGALSIAGRNTPVYLNTVEEYTQGAPISPTGAQASTLTTS
jgi:hypothetical protein